MLVASTTFCLESGGSGQVLQLSRAIHPLALIFVSYWRCSSTAVTQTLAAAKTNTREGPLSRVIAGTDRAAPLNPRNDLDICQSHLPLEPQKATPVDAILGGSGCHFYTRLIGRLPMFAPRCY